MIFLALGLTVLALVFTFGGLAQLTEDPFSAIYSTAQGVVLGYLAYLAFTGSSFAYVAGLFLAGLAASFAIASVWSALDDDGWGVVVFSAVVAVALGLWAYTILN